MYTVRSCDPSLSLLERLLVNRGVSCEAENFLNPSLAHYRTDPLLLNDMDIGTDKLIQTMKSGKSICIFWDYDVDGVTSSFLLYTLIHTYLNYKKVKIMYPNRLKDGYGMKVHHVDTIKQAWHDLIITVDNGITSIQEIIHAKNIWLDVIITDHHKSLDIIPPADAIINPQVSPNYTFKGLCGAAVVLKFASAMLKKSKLSAEERQSIMSHFVPFVAIATVADCVPLVGENRAIVKRWLEQMTRRHNLLPSLHGMLDFLNISWPIKSFHIWFVIWPGINAGGRLWSWYDSLKTLLFNGERQLWFLKDLDIINDERKRLQQDALTLAEQQLDDSQNILIATEESFHEWIVWIVAGRLTQKHNKPSIVLHISQTKWLAVGSLRWPEYFDVMAMMKSIQNETKGLYGNDYEWILVKYWWHKQAWWLSVKLEHLDLLKQLLINYCKNTISEKQMEKTIAVDTILYGHEWSEKQLEPLKAMEPFWHGNEEPVFVLPKSTITDISKVWSRWKWHLRLGLKYEGKDISSLYRSKWDLIDNYTIWQEIDIIGNIKFDDYKRIHFIDGTLI